jgi:hypothetical protein
MLDKARAHRRKRGPRPRHDEIALWDFSAVTGAIKAAKDQWPAVREKIEPYVNQGKEKLGDAYASVATVLARQKEAFEDRRAENKDKARTAKHGTAKH